MISINPHLLCGLCTRAMVILACLERMPLPDLHCSSCFMTWLLFSVVQVTTPWSAWALWAPRVSAPAVQTSPVLGKISRKHLVAELLLNGDPAVMTKRCHLVNCVFNQIIIVEWTFLRSIVDICCICCSVRQDILGKEMANWAIGRKASNRREKSQKALKNPQAHKSQDPYSRPKGQRKGSVAEIQRE